MCSPSKFKHDKFIISPDGKLFNREDYNKLSPGKVIFPSFEVYTNPTVNISNIQKRRFNLIGRVSQNISDKEDQEIFKILDAK